MFSLMTEFRDIHDPVRDKEDCELNACRRLFDRLRVAFPRLPICLLMDGLYPVQSVFDWCEESGWMFIATLREGRQPTAWEEAVQTTMLSPSNVFNVEKNGGFGLEHAFCANATASQNYHLMMQAAHTISQLLVNGLLHRLTRACRKVTDLKLIKLLRASLLSVRIDPSLPACGQIRFLSSS